MANTLADDQIPVIKESGGFRLKKPLVLVTSANVQSYIINGTGSPSGVITAPINSMYIRTDGSSGSTRIYVNTDGGTTWTNVTTAA